MVGITGGVYVPYIVGVILEAGDNLETQWQLVYYISAALFVVAGFSFALFVRAERQEWDYVECDLKVLKDDASQIS